MQKKSKNLTSTPEIVKILWYRHKVDKWSVKKISEVYNIPKSTIYRWFKFMKEEDISEDYVKFDIEKLKAETSIFPFPGEGFSNENTLSREYFKSSFELERKEAQTEPADLPNRYGFNYAFALPIDPYRIFIYWEINIHEFSNVIIKIFDNTEKEKLLHMILSSAYPVSNMYVPVGIPDRIYFAEFYPEGMKEPLLRTNEVRTPRNSPLLPEIINMYDWYNIDQAMFSISSFIINKI
ncbi:MAG: DUF4912 domain-containing protein [bacterium]